MSNDYPIPFYFLFKGRKMTKKEANWDNLITFIIFAPVAIIIGLMMVSVAHYCYTIHDYFNTVLFSIMTFLYVCWWINPKEKK